MQPTGSLTSVEITTIGPTQIEITVTSNDDQTETEAQRKTLDTLEKVKLYVAWSLPYIIILGVIGLGCGADPSFGLTGIIIGTTVGGGLGAGIGFLCAQRIIDELEEELNDGRHSAALMNRNIHQARSPRCAV